ncbi:hypothetical protein CTA1_12078 [Colletotrichum tanaceti]|uniref:Uncharacterized protein n=1 Tax=Colletotrichum tanaceti TaxID=1306861 RepID=A0A4U6XC74_9PEZI|nr:hypothetical protein CTA1_12078 [Colletotrichum tanaceti]
MTEAQPSTNRTMVTSDDLPGPLTLSAKRAKKVETKLIYGNIKSEYGCDASVYYTFEGLEELCAKGSNACESVMRGHPKVSPREPAIKAEGIWYDEDERKNLVEAITKTVRTEEPATIESKDKKWPGTCKMNQFPKFVDVTVFEDEEPKSWVDVKLAWRLPNTERHGAASFEML